MRVLARVSLWAILLGVVAGFRSHLGVRSFGTRPLFNLGHRAVDYHTNDRQGFSPLLRVGEKWRGLTQKMGGLLREGARHVRPLTPLAIRSALVTLSFMVAMRQRVFASVPVLSGAASGARTFTPAQGAGIWLFLFLLSAGMHSAESAITKISPWKVQQFAEEEGEGSPFATLSNDLTRLLSTILLTTTACSIYSTALFVTTATEMFPKLSLGVITAVLTCVTLFFGELLPKALAVNNSEMVARRFVPGLSKLAFYLSPITNMVTFLSNGVLQLCGLRSSEDKAVSEDMLRMVVDEAQRTEGIETGEGRMIKAVLDLQETSVDKIMQPRIDIVAVSESASATEILKTFVSTKYSRIPVYKESVDNIVGVIFSKDLLLSMELPADGKIVEVLPRMGEKWVKLNAAQIMEPTYFIPETMTTWNALQEMRKRRVHLAIVVDEYGGTSGLVTFEDILEEVVGEIYDEDDDDDDLREDETIFKLDDQTFEIKGYAELDNVLEALGINRDAQNGEEGGSMPPVEVTTIGGLLCSLAGEIPEAGAEVYFSGYKFRVKEVDNRRIISLEAFREDAGAGASGDGSVGDAGAAGDESAAHGGSDDASSPGGGGIWGPAQLLNNIGLGEGKQILRVVKDESSAAAAAVGEASGTAAPLASPVEVLTFVDGTWVSILCALCLAHACHRPRFPSPRMQSKAHSVSSPPPLPTHTRRSRRTLSESQRAKRYILLSVCYVRLS